MSINEYLARCHCGVLTARYQTALVPMGWGITLIIRIAHAVSDLPKATVSVPHMPAWGLAVFSLGLAWFGLWRVR